MECALLGLMFLAIAAAERVLPHGGSVANFHDPKYRIDFHSSDFPYISEELDLETLRMVDGDGRKFDCLLPNLPTKEIAQQNASSLGLAADETDLKTPEDYLALLGTAANCFHRHEGWWTYEFCFHGTLRQAHMETRKDKKEVQEYVLGEYDADATARLHMSSSYVSLQKDPRSKDAAQRYYSQMYTNGTKCDLTDIPRQTEVRFVCSETGSALISSIKEAPTCRYTLVFEAPMLCKHPFFQEEQQPWLVINCNEVSTTSTKFSTESIIKSITRKESKEEKEEEKDENIVRM